MTNRLERYIKDFSLSLKNLEEAVLKAQSDLEIDGAIKRFELCYELAWKLMKEKLADIGIICHSPRKCFKSAYENDFIEDEKKWFKMIEDRNILVHSYNFTTSREVFFHIKDEYIYLLKDFFRKVVDYE